MADHFQTIEPGTPDIVARSNLVYERAVQRTRRLNLRAQQMRRDLRADAISLTPGARPAPVRNGTASCSVVVPMPIRAAAFPPSLKSGVDAPAVKSLR